MRREKRKLGRRQLLQGVAMTAGGALLAACQPKVVEKEKIVEQTVVKEATTIVEKQVTVAPKARPKIITVNYYRGTPADPNNYIEKTVEDAFGVDIDEVFLEASTMNEQLNTRLASGWAADMYYWTVGGLRKNVDDGVLAEVPMEMIKKHAPQFWEDAKLAKVEGWLGTNVRDKNYGVPEVRIPEMQQHLTDNWRLDLLEKVGYSADKLPRTIEEFEDAFTKFVTQGLVKYAFTSRFGDQPGMCFASTFAAYGTYPNMFIVKEDKSGVVQGAAWEGARQGYETLARWYQKGLIDPKFVTNQYADCQNAWCKGEVGFFDVGQWYDSLEVEGNSFLGWAYDCAKQLGGKTIQAWPPKGPTGKSGYPNWGAATGAYPALGKHLEKDTDKMATVLNLVDAFRADPKWSIFVAYGEEGVTWTRGPNGEIAPIPEGDLEVSAAAYGLNNVMKGPLTPSRWLEANRKDIKQILERGVSGNVDFIPELGAFMDWDKCKQFTERDQVQEKWELDFITGTKPLSAWDQFVDEWLEAGGQCVLDEANQAYENMASSLQAIKDKVAQVDKS